MNGLQLFKFEGARKVRVVIRDGEPWFVAKDVCDILGLENNRDALSKMLDDDEKGVEKIYTLGGTQEMNIVSESGLYALIMRSNKPEAKVFRKWVTSVVLPSVRKTGRYLVPRTEHTQAEVKEAGRAFFMDCYREGGIAAYLEKRYPGKAGADDDPRNPVNPSTLLTRQEKRWLDEEESVAFLVKAGRL
jgi:prophage antirepressor-like protein